jgi:hypothetical protein
MAKPKDTRIYSEKRGTFHLCAEEEMSSEVWGLKTSFYSAGYGMRQARLSTLFFSFDVSRY